MKKVNFAIVVIFVVAMITIIIRGQNQAQKAPVTTGHMETTPAPKTSEPKQTGNVTLTSSVNPTFK